VNFFVFDMDGILVNTTGCHRRAFLDLWRRCGIDGPEYGEIAGRPTHEVVERYTRDLAPSPADIREWVSFKQQRARAYLAAEPVAFEDTLPCLEALRRAGRRMTVATGASRVTADLLLQRAGIARFFEFVLTAEDVGSGKPDPEIYRKAVTLAGVDPAHTVVAEDSTSGLEAAIAASTYCACVRSGLSIASPLFLGSFPDLFDFTRAFGVEI